jgi:hypothetical protein
MNRRNLLYLGVVGILLATWQAGSIEAAVSRLKTWASAETLTASALNAEFNNVLSNGEDLAWPATKAKDFDGNVLQLDGDADTTLTADTDDRLDLALSGTDLFRFDGTVATPVNGIDFIARATGSPASIQAQGSDSNVAIDFRDDNGNELVILSAVASAINEVTVTNAAIGNAVQIAATGGDTNISLNMVPKGSGVLQSGGTQVALLTANTFTANQIIQSSDAGSAGLPLLDLDRNSASPADDDNLGHLRLLGRSSTGVTREYGGIIAKILDKTNESEDGRLVLRTIVAGTTASRMLIENGMYMTGASGADKGAGTINASAVYDDGVLLANTVAASQTEQEAASSTTVFVSPGRQHFNPSAAKSWGYITYSGGTPTLQVNYNITSITDTATGVLTVTIDTNHSGVNYSVSSTAGRSSSTAIVTEDSDDRAAGAFKLTILDDANGAIDPVSISFSTFGDQ